MTLERLQIKVKGQVQGVGFRPTVHRIAKQLQLTGWVKNTASEVCIEIQGKKVSEFIEILKTDLPPLAMVKDIQVKSIASSVQETSFTIIESEYGKASTCISPDTCICSSCLTELFDPKSRYYRYPFLNCTHCGPRLTITRNMPYDRSETTMSPFLLCDECSLDYNNPDHRRYHAQATACANCGPRLSSSIEEIVQSILEGKIIAIKAMGGYQLVCDARNALAVSTLRERKNREAKPFALMAANIVTAKTIAKISETAENLLLSKERPIVLLKKHNKLLPECIAPDLSHYGIMLPSTPLHYLLFNAFLGYPDDLKWIDELQSTILVVTSANPGNNPLVMDDDKAHEQLRGIADLIVSYNRDIVTRVDDSVVHMINEAPVFIRRARGFVPVPIQLPHAIPSTLATGGHLKNTFCITRGDEAFVSQHIGSLQNKPTIDFFHETLQHLIKFLDVTPERMAHDMHPDFYTTRFAEDYDIPSYPIQHHHAHLASVAAEHSIITPVLGLALDGYGYGLNGESWGGELLLLDQTSFQRMGSLQPLPQPGGDIAIREPWRMAAGVLHQLGKSSEIEELFFDQPQVGLIRQLLDKQPNTPMTSSCGRLFDAASALLGIQTHSHYEGEAAMKLESLVTYPLSINHGWKIHEKCLDMTPLLEYLLDIDNLELGANVFHGTLIAGLTCWVKGIVREIGIDTVLLSGGCFLNKVLTEGLIKALSSHGIKSLLPRQLPPNDGGISLGQAWIAGRM